MNSREIILVVLVGVVMLVFMGLIFIIIERIMRENWGGGENKEEGFLSTIAQSNDLLVQDQFPPIGRNQVSNDGASNNWVHNPIFKLGSFEQITNNLKYWKNPDNGLCTPTNMCGALYHDSAHHPSNIVSVLPPVSSAKSGVRVGYFVQQPRK